MLEQLNTLNQRLRTLENRFFELGVDMTAIVQSEYKKRWKILPQSQTLFGMFTALCVDTVDPLKQNKVRFYSPYFHRNNTDPESLDWAYAISSMGGFDDCGLSWVPPAGSTLCIIFEKGNRATPYYIGTTWHRDRGPDGQHNWGYNIPEYYAIHEGHRKGYLAGKNDGSQVFPQWNIESYNGYDTDTFADFENNSDAVKKITYPNIYGWKTPQKHMQKNVDGDYKCNHKFKRMEWLSSCGNWMIFKDDWLHNSGAWASPYCAGIVGPINDKSCVDEQGNPIEITTCEDKKSNSSISGGHPSTPDGTTYGLDSNQQFTNPYFKHQNECRPYIGPGTPQNNKAMLPQSGIQFLSRSGQCFVMDDSVEEPQGIPEWESSLKPFDFGCSDKFLGNIAFISATGHLIKMNDAESESQLRGDQNGIKMKTASGNLFELNDHTTGKKDCAGCPPNLAGDKRGAVIVTTSNHHFMMIDEGNEQCSPCRRDNGDVKWNVDGSYNQAKATKAFVRIRSGYGLEFTMRDDFSQEKTQSQFIRIFCPQKDNTVRGPHSMIFQEVPSGPGEVFLRVGGNYICSTYDSHYTIVGEKKNPSDKIVFVSNDYVNVVEKDYYNFAKDHLFLADDYILLIAGAKLPPMCNDMDSDECVPCPCPVVCMNSAGNLVISDRVFVSASPQARCANIDQMLPFTECLPPKSCDLSEGFKDIDTDTDNTTANIA